MGQGGVRAKQSGVQLVVTPIMFTYIGRRTSMPNPYFHPYFSTCLKHSVLVGFNIIGLSSMTAWADTIRDNTMIPNDYLLLSGCPTPSLGVDGAPISIEHDKRGVLNAKATLLNAKLELQDLILGPFGILMNIGVGDSYNPFFPNAL